MRAITADVVSIIRNHWKDIHLRDSCSNRCLAEAIGYELEQRLVSVEREINKMREKRPQTDYEAGWNSALHEAAILVEEETERLKTPVPNR